MCDRTKAFDRPRNSWLIRISVCRGTCTVGQASRQLDVCPAVPGLICLSKSLSVALNKENIYFRTFSFRATGWFYKTRSGFPDGSVGKNLPASAGDRGSVPGPGRSRVWSRQAWVPQLLKLCFETRGAMAVRSQHTPTGEWPPLTTPREKPAKQRRPSMAKNK